MVGSNRTVDVRDSRDGTDKAAVVTCLIVQSHTARGVVTDSLTARQADGRGIGDECSREGDSASHSVVVAIGILADCAGVRALEGAESCTERITRRTGGICRR